MRIKNKTVLKSYSLNMPLIYLNSGYNKISNTQSKRKSFQNLIQKKDSDKRKSFQNLIQKKDSEVNTLKEEFFKNGESK